MWQALLKDPDGIAKHARTMQIWAVVCCGGTPPLPRAVLFGEEAGLEGGGGKRSLLDHAPWN